jgi:hypothetical protein
VDDGQKFREKAFAKKVIFHFEEKTITLDFVQNYDGRRSVKTPSLGKV